MRDPPDSGNSSALRGSFSLVARGREDGTEEERAEEEEKRRKRRLLPRWAGTSRPCPALPPHPPARWERDPPPQIPLPPCSARGLSDVPESPPLAQPGPPSPPHSLSPAASACSFAHIAHSICPMAAAEPARAPSAAPGSARLGPSGFGSARRSRPGRRLRRYHRRSRPLCVSHASFLTDHAPAGTRHRARATPGTRG